MKTIRLSDQTVANTTSLGEIIISQTRNYLHDMEYPASKVGLFRFAQKTGAPEIVLHAIDQLPPQSYRSTDSVVHAMRIFAKI